MDDEGKLSNQEVAEVVECEGLGYAIQHYLSADRIEDEDLAELWAEAAALLDDISGRLEID